MTWHGIHGHDDVVEGFRRRIAKRRLASTFLFVGLPGIGKRTFALKLAQALLCERSPEERLDPCETCPSCQQVLAGTHPDVALVAREKSRARITIEQLVGPDDRRMQEGLVHAIGLKPFAGRRKIGIIDDADTLAHGQGESANCLLKTLEEPPPHSLLILIGTSEQRQLPTIRSRAQVIRFQPLEESIVAQLLGELKLVEDATLAAQLAELSTGSLQTALDFADAEVREFRGRWLKFLSDAQPEATAFSKPLASFVDDAGKDAPSRRARLRLLAMGAIDYYRQLIRALHGQDVEGDEVLRKAVASGVRGWNLEIEVAAAALDRCLEAIAQVDANANQATLIDAWLDDLAQLRLVGHV
jgi:DNA polymerase-3 subunit delta'